MDHLVGVPVPPLRLTASTGSGVDLTAAGDPWAVLLVHPPPAGLAGFAERGSEFAELGCEVYAISAEDHGAGLPVLLDPNRLLADALDLENGPLTLVVRHARVVHVFDPVPDPGEALRWLREDAAAAAA